MEESRIFYTQERAIEAIAQATSAEEVEAVLNRTEMETEALVLEEVLSRTPHLNHGLILRAFEAPSSIHSLIQNEKFLSNDSLVTSAMDHALMQGRRKKGMHSAGFIFFQIMFEKGFIQEDHWCLDELWAMLRHETNFRKDWVKAFAADLLVFSDFERGTFASEDLQELASSISRMSAEKLQNHPNVTPEVWATIMRNERAGLYLHGRVVNLPAAMSNRSIRQALLDTKRYKTDVLVIKALAKYAEPGEEFREVWRRVAHLSPVHALETIEASTPWQLRSIKAVDLHPLLKDGDPELRLKVMRMLPHFKEEPETPKQKARTR